MLRSSLAALTGTCALVALSACIETIPLAQPPSQTLVAVAPGNVPGVPGVPTTTVKPTLTASTAKVSLVLGAEQALNDALRDQSGLAPTGGVLWLSNNSSVVTVNPLTGQAKAVAPGTTILTASLQSAPSVQAQVTVTVTATGRTVQISVSPANPTMKPGDQVTLTAEVHAADGTISGNVDWQSSDDTLATVNKTTGVVSALRPGHVTIRAAYGLDGGQFSVSSVTVIDPNALAAATPQPTATPTPRPVATPTPQPTATPTPVPSWTPSPVPSVSPTPTPVPTATPTPTANTSANTSV